MVTNFIGKIGFFDQRTFICRFVVPKRIEISQRRWAGDGRIEFAYPFWIGGRLGVLLCYWNLSLIIHSVLLIKHMLLLRPDLYGRPTRSHCSTEQWLSATTSLVLVDARLWSSRETELSCIISAHIARGNVYWPSFTAKHLVGFPNILLGVTLPGGLHADHEFL